VKESEKEMKGNEMSAILATSLTLSGVLGIVPIAHPEQIVLIGTYSPDVSPCAAPPTTNSLDDVNCYYNFTFGLSKKAVPGIPPAYTSANYSDTPNSQNTFFSVLQVGDLKGDDPINFKGIVIVASDYLAYHSSVHMYTRAMNFGKINFKDVTLSAGYYVTYWSA
jgi:hypothetical protein